MNDPVMGGKSKSSLVIENGVATFEGTCAIVPFLHAPGFITMVTGNPYSFNPFKAKSIFPDVSACNGITINIRSRTQYNGYYISFGTDRVPGGGHAMGYKTSLFKDNKVPFGLDFVDITIPFNEFSSNWDEGSGKTKISCKDDIIYCPSMSTLQNMKSISFWGEGVEGDVALDIRYIGAVGCSTTSSSSSSSSGGEGDLTAAAAGTIIGSHQQQQQQEIGGGYNLTIVSLFSVIVIMMALFGVYRRIVSNKKQESYEELDHIMIDNEDKDTDDDGEEIDSTTVVVV